MGQDQTNQASQDDRGDHVEARLEAQRGRSNQETGCQQNGQKRKLKPMFKSILEPEKTETSEDATLKHFKKFVFTLRNDRKLVAPKHWKLTDTKDIDTLLKIYARRVRVTDAF